MHILSSEHLKTELGEIKDFIISIIKNFDVVKVPG